MSAQYLDDKNLREDALTDKEEAAIADKKVREIMGSDFERQQAADSLHSIANSSNARSASKDANLSVAAGAGKNVDNPGQTNEKNQKLNDYRKNLAGARNRKDGSLKDLPNAKSEEPRNSGSPDDSKNKFKGDLNKARNKNRLQKMGDNLQQKGEKMGGKAGGAMKGVGQAAKMAGEAKKAANAAKSGLALLRHIDMFKDWLFLLAFFAALLKDISDFALIGSFPGWGTVISLCCSILIFFLILLAGAGEKRSSTKAMVKKIMTMMGGTLAEFLPGINFLPIETIIVIYIYIIVLAERKTAEEEAATEGNGEQEE